MSAHAVERSGRRRFCATVLPLLSVASACRAATAALSTPTDIGVRPPIDARGRRVLRVGPGRRLRTIAAAAAEARDGDLIEVDAGEYTGDVAVWRQSGLTIRALGGRAHLLAGGASAEGKAIWVMRAGSLEIEGFDFSAARVPGRNGAGIRFESGRMLVRNCAFLDNETGILTANDNRAELEIEGCEFGRNGAGDGQSHNLYVGSIRRFTVTGSYFHGAQVGHLLKSRAAENHVLYNRLTDEAAGRASYELEFAAGGLAYVIGNLIQQGPATENPALVSFGAEGYAWPRNELYLINNTLVDERASAGRFLALRAGAGRVLVMNNILSGHGRLDPGGGAEERNNFAVEAGDLASPTRYDYRLKADSRIAGRGEDPGMANGVRLMPAREYVHPRGTRPLGSGPLHPGAEQRLAPVS